MPLLPEQPYTTQSLHIRNLCVTGVASALSVFATPPYFETLYIHEFGKQVILNVSFEKPMPITESQLNNLVIQFSRQAMRLFALSESQVLLRAAVLRMGKSSTMIEVKQLYESGALALSTTIDKVEPRVGMTFLVQISDVISNKTYVWLHVDGIEPELVGRIVSLDERQRIIYSQPTKKRGLQALFDQEKKS